MKRVGIFCILILACGLGASASGVKELTSFSYLGVDSVEVRGDFLDIEVAADDDFALTMRADLPEDTFFEPRNYRVVHEMVGSRLTVWVEKDADPFATLRHGKLVFSVPRGIELYVETSSGSIMVVGMDTNSASVKSASGSVDLDRTRRRIRASSVSGSLRISDLRGDGSLSTVSGRIEVNGLRGTLSAKTVSGSIEGKEISLSGDSYFGSTSGDIDVRLDNPLEDLRFDLSSVSGRLAVGTISAQMGLRRGSGFSLVRGETISGSQTYR